jgi:hemoglobin/transferrin/lactoferrin receptor protein
MVGIRRGAYALLASVALGAVMIGSVSTSAPAQTTAPAQEQPLPPVRVEAPPAPKHRAATKPAPGPKVAQHRAAPAKPVVSNEPTTSVATKTEEPVINTLAAVSVLRQEQINQTQPTRLSDILVGMPGVSNPERGDDPGSSINIRGLQDFGRVATLVDGVPQDFQRSGHFANGQFYLDPEMVGGVDVVRGPVANIYGSGAIGGVAAFQTKDLNDILLPGEIAALQSHVMYGSNGNEWLASIFGGARGAEGDIFLGGVYRDSGNYTSGSGTLNSLQCDSSCAGWPTTTIPGNTSVPNTGDQTESGLAKLTLRPSDGQQIKLTAITYNTDYNFGDTTGAGTTIPGIGVYGENIKNQTVTAQYTYARPDTPLIAFQGNLYWNQTVVHETVEIPYVVPNPAPPPATIDFTGPPGTTNSFMLNTSGFNVNNTSRFDTGAWRHAVTYGGDFNNDAMDVGTGCAGDFVPNCDVSLTPGGHRNTYGGFVEWKANYASWFEMINAVRYDGFALIGDGSSESGSRLSPKTTVGITPFPGFQPYVSYAEGYRAPAVTEAFISGFHPGGFAYFEPNPNLRPEIGKTKEVGINIKYDNVFSPGDKIRAKINAFRNDITDYIDQVTDLSAFFGLPPPPACQQFMGPTPCLQYQNIGNARIEGLEFELNYDAGSWFGGISGQHLRGKGESNDPTVVAAGTCATAPTAVGCAGAPLASIPPDQISFLLGARFLDQKLKLAVRWTAVAAKPLSQIPTTIDSDLNPASPSVVPMFDSTGSYNLVSLYAGYQVTPEVLAAFSVDNLLNENYTKYMCCSTYAGYVVPNPGITFKGSLTFHEGVKGGDASAKGNNS